MALVRIRPVEAGAGMMVVPNAQSTLLRATEVLADALVVTESDGTIVSANSAFLEMAQLPTVDHAEGEAVDRWLGRPGVDTAVLMLNLSERGSVNLFATVMRSDFGSERSVEVSATVIPDATPPRFAFTIRDVGLRLTDGNEKGTINEGSIENLRELVGRVSLKEIVRETSDMIERMCIETALELTTDNRAAAAEMLGLSRQSLYVKMRRFGLGDLDSDDENS
jgi:transcriptional regulator PpsR